MSKVNWNSPFEMEPSEEFKKDNPSLKLLKYTDPLGETRVCAIVKDAPKEALNEAVKDILSPVKEHPNYYSEEILKKLYHYK